jgi:hypothetical protein
MVLRACNRWPARSSYAGVLGLASGWPTALENLTVCAASQDGRVSCMISLVCSSSSSSIDHILFLLSSASYTLRLQSSI